MPAARDTYGNDWRLEGGVPQVRPAGATAWQTVAAAPAGGWRHLLADGVGFVWIGGDAGLRRHDPHRADAGWATPAAPDLPAAGVTALARSPDGLAMAGFAGGEVVEVDIDADGATTARVLVRADGAVRAVACDADGGVRVAAAGGAAGRPPASDAWQRHWRDVARLPCGNHDLFAIAIDGRLWMAGGLTSGRGYPPRTHVFDDVFSYDPDADRWETVARLPFPRCYSGIAELDGQVWIVGGAANLEAPADPDGKRRPLADVRVYDESSGLWREGPALGRARLEPVVVAAGGRLWAIGGSDGDSLDVVESIGPGESAWRAEAALPWPQSQADGCVLGDRVYCVSRAGFVALDPATGAWDTDLPQLQASPQAAQVAACGGEVWVMGGSRRRDTHIYDPAARAWRDGPDLPTDNSWGAAVVLGECLVVAGGAHWSPRHKRYFFDDRVLVLR